MRQFKIRSTGTSLIFKIIRTLFIRSSVMRMRVFKIRWRIYFFLSRRICQNCQERLLSIIKNIDAIYLPLSFLFCSMAYPQGRLRQRARNCSFSFNFILHYSTFCPLLSRTRIIRVSISFHTKNAKDVIKYSWKEIFLSVDR